MVWGWMSLPFVGVHVYYLTYCRPGFNVVIMTGDAALRDNDISRLATLCVGLFLLTGGCMNGARNHVKPMHRAERPLLVPSPACASFLM